jgi:hypothetical protein
LTLGFIIKKERRPTALKRGKRGRASKTEKGLRERQLEAAGEEEEADWEKAGKGKREDA